MHTKYFGRLPETWYKRNENENAKGWHKGCQAALQQKNETNKGKWNNNNIGLAVYFSTHISLRRPHDLKAWNRLM